MSFRRTIVPLTFTLVGLFMQAESAVAQSAIDPSSALLLNPASRSSGLSSEKPDARTDSSRYTVRPRVVNERPERNSTSQAPPQPVVKQLAPEATPVPVVLAPAENGAVIVTLDPVSGPALNDVKTEDERGLAKPIITPVIASKHILEISVATAYLYENAESNYSFRQATIGGPAYAASARAWIVSEFAVGGRYLSTLGGQIADRGAALSAGRTEIAYGLYFRKNFAESNLIFAAEYVDSEFKVSSDAVSKLKTRSSGVRVSIESEFQTSTSSWSLGFSVMPKLQHQEISAGTEVRSGTSVNAYSVGASVTRGWKFDSSHNVFVKLEQKLERDLFSGAATLADPLGGATPNGVGVTVGTTLIQFGYGWGD